MTDFIEWCIIASAIVGYINYAVLIIIANNLRGIKTEILKLKNQKGGEE